MNTATLQNLAEPWRTDFLMKIETFETVGFNSSIVREVANDMARFSLEDLGKLHVLHNLTVLFKYLNDEDRTQPAQQLYEEHVTPTRHLAF